MGRAEENLKRNLKILQALDKAIKEGKWEGKLLFQATGKKLREIRDRLRATLHLDEMISEASDQIAERAATRSSQVEVFVSLYNSDGNDLKKWEMVIKSLETNVITRLIYINEADIQTAIRSKANKKNEAYLSVFINKSAILTPTGKQLPRDRLGHETLLVKEGALNLDNISRFVHISGEYEFKDNHLAKITTEPQNL